MPSLSLCWLHETSVRKNVDSLWITCAILVDTKLLRYGVSPNRLAIEQSAWRMVPLEPPLFAAQATKRAQRVLSTPNGHSPLLLSRGMLLNGTCGDAASVRRWYHVV